MVDRTSHPAGSANSINATILEFEYELGSVLLKPDSILKIPPTNWLWEQGIPIYVAEDYPENAKLQPPPLGKAPGLKEIFSFAETRDGWLHSLDGSPVPGLVAPEMWLWKLKAKAFSASLLRLRAKGRRSRKQINDRLLVGTRRMCFRDLAEVEGRLFPGQLRSAQGPRSLREHLYRSSHIVVASTSGTSGIYGICCARVLNQGGFQLTGLWVHPEYRRRGVALALLRDLSATSGVREILAASCQTDAERAFWTAYAMRPDTSLRTEAISFEGQPWAAL